MGRGGNGGNKQYGNRRIRSKDKGSDESDEDYTLRTDEEFEDSEYCSSLAGEESEESLGEFEEDEEEDKEEEKVKKVGKSKGRKGFLSRKKNGVGKAPKKKCVSFEEENSEDCKDEDYDYDDDNDDEDEEFTPDGIDLDNEDELAVNKKNKKVGRPPSQEKGFVKRRNRKRNSKVTKKPMRKKPMKSHWLQRKSAASNDAAFTKKNPILRKSSEKNSGQRRRRFMSDSDSDFMSSGSSDFEYTISEEEREQVRETSEFCGYLTTMLRNSSSKKRLREEGFLCQQRKCLGRKGKEKVEDLKYEAGKQVCGICLSEEGKKTVQGTLNCCSHYFCFACIMEWSKVESRCPLCKERFVTISKPTRSNTGFDLTTIVVEVPERDQVYQPSEEELRGYLDPYENVICIECQQGGDDAFMLLCDLCDSPAHTYCVGLGREVPEGNWYCKGCRPTALSSPNPQASNPTLDQRTFIGLSGRSSSVANVREDIDLNTMYVPETPLTQGTGVFSSPGRPDGDFQAASSLSGGGVVTVSVRCRLNREIRNLLDNIRSLPVDRTTRMSATTSGNNLLGFQIERVREIAFQPAITPERLPSHHTFSQGRLQGNFSHSIQSRDPFLARSSHSRGQQAGLAGISMDINTRSGFEQFHPCSSRSSIGDTSMSPRRYRETTAPSASRALQGVLHPPF